MGGPIAQQAGRAASGAAWSVARTLSGRQAVSVRSIVMASGVREARLGKYS